jgi:hypothetical protein
MLTITAPERHGELREIGGRRNQRQRASRRKHRAAIDRTKRPRTEIARACRGKRNRTHLDPTRVRRVVHHHIDLSTRTRQEFAVRDRRSKVRAKGTGIPSKGILHFLEQT